MAEYDRLGPDGFFEQYRYGDALGYVIEYEGKRYPSKGIYGVAYDSLHPDQPSLRETSFSGGLQRVVPELRELDFEIQNLKQPADRLRQGIEQILAQYGARGAHLWGRQAAR